MRHCPDSVYAAPWQHVLRVLYVDELALLAEDDSAFAILAIGSGSFFLVLNVTQSLSACTLFFKVIQKGSEWRRTLANLQGHRPTDCCS